MGNYKQYRDKHLISDWEGLLSKSIEYIEELYEEWLEVEEYNGKLSKDLYEEKWDRIKEINKVMEGNGVDIKKYRGTGWNKKFNGYKSWYKKNVIDVIEGKYSKMPSMPYAHADRKEVQGVDLGNSQSPTTIVELYKKIKSQYDMGKRKVLKEDKLFIESMKYVTEHSINIEGLLPEEIIKQVNEHAKWEYEKEHLKPGTEIYLKHECDYCDTYTCGEGRCECGNRRIDVVVEGNIIDGFSYYTEPY